MCSQGNDGYVCTKKQPAYPYSPGEQLSIAPEKFVTEKRTFYYLLRVAYAMFVLALFFSLLSIFPILLTFCGLGFLSGFLASWVVISALFFTAVGAALNTAAHVKGVKLFNEAGFTAHIGTNMFVFMWLTVALLLITYLWVTFVGIHGFREKFEHHEIEHHDEKSV